MDLLRNFACILLLYASFWNKVNTLFCESPQYIELEKTGIIKCTVDENYVGIYWYNSTESRKNTPLLSREGTSIGGAVYPSDEFQLLSNGSLFIRHVTLHHEHTFRIVLVINKELGLIEKRDIQIVVIVKPLQDHPLISYCGAERGCLLAAEAITDLKCTVAEVRPAPILKWALRKSVEDTDYPSNSSLSLGENWFSTTSGITTHLFNITVLLVCKALGPPPLLTYSESFIVIETNDEDASLTEKTSINIELGSQMIIKCAEDKPTFLKWKRKLQSGIFQTIAFAIFGEPFYSKVYIDKFDIGLDGSLIADEIKAEDEGIFTCLTGDGNNIERKSFNITAFAYPHPAMPVVEGCNHNHHCALAVNIQDRLKCSLYRIRPLVQLEWVVLTNISDEVVTFHNYQHSTSNYNDGTFDVHLTTDFSVLGTSQPTITVACKTKSSKNVLSTRIDLLITDDYLIPHTPPATVSPEGMGKLHLLWITLPFLCVILCGIGFIYKRAITRQARETSASVKDQEMTPMMETEKQYVQAKIVELPNEEEMIEPLFAMSKEENLNLKGVFIQQLQNKYKLQYESIRPIPYIRDKMFIVKSIFVESTIETLLQDGKEDHTDTGIWEKLNNYHELLKFNSSTSSRKIIQGDPGYGKSTLTLQMAYDWSTRQSYSPLREKEILILLRLRQLFKIESIYKAIRLFLLPRDTKINDSDIKDILQKCSSAVIILDGFDEYPYQHGEILTDVTRIIAGDMFQEFSVILCTRPMSLPPQIPPRTQRVRLTGFDRTAQEVYIRKAVTGNTVLAEKIHTRLKENPVLVDFCEVPLFFVMFAHMTNENEKFQDVNSITSFFRHVIRCFHSHLQNKVKDENVHHYKIFEKDHTNLDEVSFQFLTSKQETLWRKDEMRKNVGDRFYDYYVRLGILCEEEVFDSNIDESATEDIPYRMDVRFYHKLFCEWYAAHHLSRLAEDLNFLRFKGVLKKLDLFELHYVFRFACGLNTTAARKILKHLNSIKNGEHFAILCILEQTGNFIDIKESVSKICSDVIHLSCNDNRVLQRSIIQLMIIASRNEVRISEVWLRNCLNSADDSGECLQLNTGLSLPRLDTMFHLHIYNEGSRMTFAETINIIKFATLSSKMQEIRFHLCLLPQSLECEQVLKILYERNIKVSWAPDAFRTLFLDRDGLWENKDGSKLNESAYEKEITKNEMYV